MKWKFKRSLFCKRETVHLFNLGTCKVIWLEMQIGSSLYIVQDEMEEDKEIVVRPSQLLFVLILICGWAVLRSYELVWIV